MKLKKLLIGLIVSTSLLTGCGPSASSSSNNGGVGPGYTKNVIPSTVEYSAVDKKMKIIPIGSTEYIISDTILAIKQYLPTLQEDVDYEKRPDMSYIGVKDNDVIYIEIGSMCGKDDKTCESRSVEKEYERLNYNSVLIIYN